MSLTRTPPSVQPSTSVPGAVPIPQLLEHCSSEPSLASEPATELGTPRGSTPNMVFRNSKRKRVVCDDETLVCFMDEMKKMMSDFQAEQSSKHEKLLAVVNGLEKERTVNFQYISSLESKVDSFERSARSTCIEIRNLPTSQPETKSSLVENVVQIGKILNVPMLTTEVKDIFRIKTKDPANKTVIVDFTSVLLKERFVSKYKKCNKENNRLTTEKLRISGPSKPIFISENLSTKLKKLFYLAREHAKANDFKFCWASNGKIFLRKREGGPLVRVNNESDLKISSDNQ
ncbi:Zinc finger DNA binding protein [Operophtera brumata]|uniref:Zinc finger DNA binding protein n=1 Tax=Operophtera brumata TaxID=104452 RepID=A0A0L7KFH2_OPEBR|nr:Zinc finger DNA binding protein [Operophtera brumata]